MLKRQRSSHEAEAPENVTDQRGEDGFEKTALVHIEIRPSQDRVQAMPAPRTMIA